jgi:hypothetical protein
MWRALPVIGVAVDSISVCLKLEIASGAFPEGRGVYCGVAIGQGEKGSLENKLNQPPLDRG